MEQKFTTMAQEVIGDAIQSASAAGNAQVETLHVMDALLRQENGVIQGLIQAAGGNPQAIGAAVRNALVKMPAASGSTTSQPQASRQLTAALAQAEKEMQQMGDEYVSTEHLLIGIAAAALCCFFWLPDSQPGDVSGSSIIRLWSMTRWISRWFVLVGRWIHRSGISRRLKI